MEKKTLTALIELATVAVAVYAQDRNVRADVYLKLTRVSMWTAEQFGRLAMASELKYRQAVAP